jgi:hypothetical protein
MFCLCNTPNSIEEVVWSESVSTSQQSNRTRWLLILAYYLLTYCVNVSAISDGLNLTNDATRAANFSLPGLGPVLSVLFTDSVNCYDYIASVAVQSIDGITLTQILGEKPVPVLRFF